MFKVTNLSNGPLHVRDGMYLTPEASCHCETLSDEARKYEARGWLMIVEIATAQSEPQQKTKDTTPENSGKKGGEK